jgi:hypothetical protein
MAQRVETVQLKEDTLLAYAAHIREAEAAMEQTLNGESPACGRMPVLRERNRFGKSGR